MNDFSVYIRPLTVEDAEISYKWRNNPKIWRFTGSRPNMVVTHEMEKAWLEKVLQRKNERRFAICLKESNTYIGNIYLTDIDNDSACIQIFIGDVENWGRRRAAEAAVQLITFGFEELKLKQLVAIIADNNILSTALTKSFQFIKGEQYLDTTENKLYNKWFFTFQMFQQNMHLKALEKRTGILKNKSQD